MTFTAQGVLDMAWRSVVDPRAVAKEMLALSIPTNVLWQALIAVVLLSTVFSGLVSMIFGASAGSEIVNLMSRPLVSAGSSLVLIAGGIYALHWAGRFFNGQGTFEEMLLMITWLQIVVFIAEIALVAMIQILQPLGVLMVIAFFGASIWILICFVDAVHRFDNLAKAIGVILVAGIGLLVTLTTLLALLGVSPEAMLINV